MLLQWVRHNYILIGAGLSFLLFSLLDSFNIWKCPVFALTGYFCPGCGSTRAMHSLIELDIAGAISNNLLLLLSPVLAILGILISKKKVFYLNFGYFTLLTSFVIIFVVIRNIPGSSLAPI
jgi:hypothetical protein